MVISGFVFGICQTPECPDLGMPVTSFQMSRKAAIGKQGGLLREETSASLRGSAENWTGLLGAPHCLRCPPGGNLSCSRLRFQCTVENKEIQLSSGPLAPPAAWAKTLPASEVVFHHEGNVTHCLSICFDLNFQFPSSV